MDCIKICFQLQRGNPAFSTEDDQDYVMPDAIPSCSNFSCEGIADPSLQCYAQLPPRTGSDEKSAPCYLDVSYETQTDRTTCTTTIRSQKCQRTVSSPDSPNNICKACLEAKHLVLRKQVRQTIAEKQALKKFAPLSRVSKARV